MSLNDLLNINIALKNYSESFKQDDEAYAQTFNRMKYKTETEIRSLNLIDDIEMLKN